MTAITKYKGFFLAICFSRLKSCLVGTVYSKRFKHKFYYYTKTHYGYLEASLLIEMEEVVDKFIKKEKSYLEKQVEETKKMLAYLNSQKHSLLEEENGTNK